MKLITAIMKPCKLDDVREALAEVGVQGMTVTEVKGFGRQKGHTELYRGAEYVVDFLPKVKIEAAIDDALQDQNIEGLRQSANKGKDGGGTIFVTDIAEAVRNRTGTVSWNRLRRHKKRKVWKWGVWDGTESKHRQEGTRKREG